MKLTPDSLIDNEKDALVEAVMRLLLHIGLPTGGDSQELAARIRKQYALSDSFAGKV